MGYPSSIQIHRLKMQAHLVSLRNHSPGATPRFGTARDTPQSVNSITNEGLKAKNGRVLRKIYTAYMIEPIPSILL